MKQRTVSLAPVLALLAIIAALEAWYLVAKPPLPKAEPTPATTPLTST